MSEITSDITSDTTSDTTANSILTPALALDDVPAVEPVPATAAPPARWSFATRLAFRLAFCYLMMYALCCGNATLWSVIPWLGGRISYWLAWPFRHAGQWLAQHLFHLTGVGAKLHGGGSGDRAIDWIAMGVMLAVAIAATLLWTALDEFPRNKRRNAYPKLFRWFRFTLRLALGVAMLNYGFAKLFPLQMAPPSLAVLNEPLGNTSPMTMLWTLIGLSPVYEMVCGAAEIAGGLLVLFRRTALLGALLTAFLTTNIVLYNFCFDVPVKIYAAHLLLWSIALIVPDLSTLFGFFWRHEPSSLHTPWSPWSGRLGRRIETIAIAVVTFLVVGFTISQLAPFYSKQLASQRHPPALTGEWHVDSATLAGKPTPYLTGDGLPMTAIYFEPSGRVMLRATDDVLWRAGDKIDDKKHTLQLFSAGHQDAAVYAMTNPDPSHLVLTPTGKQARKDGALTLTRVPLPSHYPLLDRGFHLVNEWGLER